jgi:predicted transcriptional regulator
LGCAHSAHRRYNLKVIAEAQDRSPHWMMCEAIARYVAGEEKREAFRCCGIRVQNAYQETGLHVTHAAADAWLL